MPEKTAIQELLPYTTAFPNAVNQAKKKQGLTSQAIADASGIPYSSVSKFLSGHTSDPRLYNAAAVCRVLGLSLDQLMGLSPAPGSADPEEIARLKVELAIANNSIFHYKRILVYRRQFIYILTGLCILLAVILSACLVLDSSLGEAGLIRYTGAHWLVLVAVASVVATFALVIINAILMVRKERKDKHD